MFHGPALVVIVGIDEILLFAPYYGEEFAVLSGSGPQGFRGNQPMELKDNNGRLEIELPSMLDLPAASELRDTLLDALARDTGAELVLKAAAVERVSTAWIQVVLAGAAAFSGAARRLEVDGASDALAAAFRHLGLAPDLDTLKT